MKRMNPWQRYRAFPCSYVATGCAYEDMHHTSFFGVLPDGLRDDGYVPLKYINTFVRKYLPVKKKLYFNKKSRIKLSDFLKEHKESMIICLLGHCIYANGGDYMSFFDNEDDTVVCVWYLNEPSHSPFA